MIDGGLQGPGDTLFWNGMSIEHEMTYCSSLNRFLVVTVRTGKSGRVDTVYPPLFLSTVP